MEINVYGYISPENPTYQKHAKVLKACINASIEKLPEETARYFNSYKNIPDVEDLDKKLEIKIPIHDKFTDDSEEYEIFIHELPKGIYKIKIIYA